MQNFKIMKSCFFKLSLAAIAAMAFTGSASAVTFSLNQFNVAGYTGPFGQAVVTLDNATNATVTFSSFNNGGYNYLFGGQGAVAVNVNASSWTLGTITPVLAPPMTNGGANNEDGWGIFNQTFDNFDGFGYAQTGFTVHLTNTGGTWGSDTDVLKANASGYLVAAHIFVANPDGTTHIVNGEGVTGYATDDASPGPHTDVPEGGSTVALLGGALMLIGGIARRVIGIA